MDKIKLELFVGSNFREEEGYQTIGIDIVQPKSKPENCLFFKLNLGFQPLPNLDSSIDKVNIFDGLEHTAKIVYVQDSEGNIEKLTPFIFLMNEIYRVMKHDALLTIEVPFGDIAFRRDPTHQTQLGDDWFEYFCKDGTKLYHDQGLINTDFVLKSNTFRKYLWTDKDIMRTELIARKQIKQKVLI